MKKKPRSIIHIKIRPSSSKYPINNVSIKKNNSTSAVRPS